jgi:hypothetical protein
LRIIHQTAQPYLFGRHQRFQVVVQETPTAKNCVLDAVRKRDQIGNLRCVSETFPNSCLATIQALNNCKLFSSVQLHA